MTPLMKEMVFNKGKDIVKEMAHVEGYTESFAKHFVDGFAEGLDERSDELLAEYKVKGLQKYLLRFVEKRYPAVSASLDAKIRSIKEPESLYSLIDTTEQYNDFAAFERTVENTLQQTCTK
jgi:hypothetical protein